MTKIIAFLKLHFSKNKTLTLSLMASLLIHAFLFNQFRFNIPMKNEGPPALIVRLVKLQSTQKMAVATTSTPLPTTETISKPQQTEQDLMATANISTTASSEQMQATPITKIIPNVTQQNVAAVEQPITNASNTDANKTVDETAAGELAKKPIPQPYQYVETEFDVHRGDAADSVGIARIVFILDKNRTYTLTSMVNAEGLTSQTRGTLMLKSEGVVTIAGLTPSYFSYQDNTDKNKSHSVRFAWSDGILQMHSPSGDSTETLPAATQDTLSAIYQFMFAPPSENTQVSTTNGKNLRISTYNFQGEVLLTSPLGELKTIHLVKNDDDGELELWLAPDYQYLPIKIRQTEKNGSFIEQIATKIFKILP